MWLPILWVEVVIPASLQDQVFNLLHLVLFGMQRMKQLARSALYWLRIDQDIERISRQCTVCAEFQHQPAIHLWMQPEKPSSRLHTDHGISFLDHDWLALVDAYSKYPCIHMTSTFTNATTKLLEQDLPTLGIHTDSP